MGAYIFCAFLFIRSTDMWGLWIISLRLFCEANYMAISYRSLHSSYYSITFCSFLSCAQMHETTSAENKIKKTVFHHFFLLLKVGFSVHKIFLHDCAQFNNRATAKPTTPSSMNCDVLMHGKLSIPRCIHAASCALYAAGCRHCRRLLISFFRCSFPRCDLIYKWNSQNRKKEKKEKCASKEMKTIIRRLGKRWN